ncbi:putative acetyltransferase [Posidoniimonas polymericola]|uniref:Putative acetyltransferase n=1 Tax=Posidoniimonas polymericola TaxID=2528002 RepID=A0A5C5XTV9_9BACT|nr:GNAT family N-acetyltransferase [Posidoniimonas polymericola]TWT66324.1 putative acetyltransferase [Posidoniimonas polymericola]
MSLTYHKRFQMERRIGAELSLPPLPPGYRFAPWSTGRLLDHTEAKHLAFGEELDAQLFDCLRTAEGCERLMREIARKPGFLPEATWLVEYVASPSKIEPCGTIQGIRTSPRAGAIQNVGVTPMHRGRGLGAALVSAATVGFQQAGLSRVCLEVTAANTAAVRLYQRLGFRRTKTLYKAVEVAYSLG